MQFTNIQAVFVCHFQKSPDPSIPMPANGEPLTIFVPVHVDDGLVSMNSSALYLWFIRTINTHFPVIDQGTATTYISIRISRNRANHLLWLSQEVYIDKLLENYGLQDCSYNNLPLHLPLPPNLLQKLFYVIPI